MYSYGSPHMAVQKQDDQHERTFSSYVRIQVTVLKTYLGRWMIGRSGERGSGISVLPARYDDDEIYMIWFGWVLWHINHCWLFNAKSSLYIYIKYIWFDWVLWYTNHCRLFNAWSIFIHINSSISNNSV